MQATPVAPGAGTQAGDTTIHRMDEQFRKLLRYRSLKLQLKEIRAEMLGLEQELFRQPELRS